MNPCPHCGNELPEGAKFCGVCGASLNGDPANSRPVRNVNPPHYQGTQRRNVPRCTHCGYVGNWKVEPIMRPMDWVLTVLFAIPFIFPAFCYLLPVLLIRSNQDKRAKICPKCNARNLWTFIY